MDHIEAENFANALMLAAGIGLAALGLWPIYRVATGATVDYGHDYAASVHTGCLVSLTSGEPVGLPLPAHMAGKWRGEYRVACPGKPPSPIVVTCAEGVCVQTSPVLVLPEDAP